MKKVLVAAMLAAVMLVAAVPSAGAKTTAQKIAALQKSVKSLAKANTALSARVKKAEARLATQEATSDLLVSSSLLLLGLSNCQTNTVSSDFTFSDGVRSESWFAGDAFGPNPAGGFDFCVQQAVAVVSSTSSASRLAPRASSGLLPLIQSAIKVKAGAIHATR